MDLEFIVSYLFAFHLALLFVKVWALYHITKLIILIESPNTEKYMLIFKPFEIALFTVSIIMVVSELSFLFYFFVDLDLYPYEYLAIVDQIFFTFLTITYIKREVKGNG